MKPKKPAPITLATHFYIKLVGVSPRQSKKAGPFKYHRGHDALIFEGREIPLSEFHDIVPAALNRYNGIYSLRLPEIVLLDLSNVSKSPPLQFPVSTHLPAPAVVFGDVSDEQGTAQDAETSGLARESEPEAEVSPEPEPEADPDAAAPDVSPSPPLPVSESPSPKKGGRPQKYGKGGQPVK